MFVSFFIVRSSFGNINEPEKKYSEERVVSVFGDSNSTKTHEKLLGPFWGFCFCLCGDDYLICN